MKYKKSIIFLIIAMISLGLIGCNSLDKNLSEADSLIDEGKYDEALSIYRELLAKGEDNIGIYKGMLRVHSKEENLDKQEEILDVLWEKYRDNEEAEDIILEYALPLENYDLASKLLLENLENRGGYKRYEALMEIYRDMGDIESMERLYNKYGEDYTTDRSLLLLAREYGRSGDIEKIDILVENMDFRQDTDDELIAFIFNIYRKFQNEDRIVTTLDRLNEANNESPTVSAYNYIIKKYGLDSLIDFAAMDLDNDDKTEVVALIAEGRLPNGFMELLIFDEDGNPIDRMELKVPAYEYDISFGDLEGDGSKYIMVSNHGGLKAKELDYRIFAYKDSSLKSVTMDFSNSFQVNYMDDFKLDISSKDLNKSVELVLSETVKPLFIKGNGYSEVYDKDGRLLKDDSEVYLDSFDMEFKNREENDVIVRTNHLAEDKSSNTYMGTINEVFQLKDGRLELADIVVRDLNNNIIESTDYLDRSIDI